MIQRFRQGSRALLAFAQPVDDGLAECYLSPQQYKLFRRMRHSEQLHSVRVLQSVLAQDTKTPNVLAVAALLHDVGKSRYKLRVWQKTIAVLIQKFMPALYHRWSTDEPTHWWQRPVSVRAHHPAWGAVMLSRIDTGPAIVWLIAHHQDEAEHLRDHPYHALLVRLQAADDAN